MNAFRPLSARGVADSRFDDLQEGIPAWLAKPVEDWLRPFHTYRSPQGPVHVRTDFLQDLQMRLRLDPPLDWGKPFWARDDFVRRVTGDGEFALDVLDYIALHIDGLGGSGQPEGKIEALNELLREGGSAWEATPVPGEAARWTLTRRQLGPTGDAIMEIGSNAGRAGDHLLTAWVRLSSRNPDPSSAYREAVRAIEAAAKPVVSPNDSVATLGKMIGALRAKPAKWSFELGAVELIADMCESVWTSQLDRHGTDDETVPLSVTQEQADAAVHMAIVLTRYFVGGAIR